MWVQLCVSAWLSAAGADGPTFAPPPAAAKGDAGALLKEKVAKLSELKSYAFEVLDDGMGGFGRGRGRGGGGAGGGGGDAAAGGAPPAPTPTTAKVEVGSKSVAFTRGETVAYRVDKKTVYKKGEAWELYVPFEFGGGNRGGGPGGGGAPPGGAGGAPPAGGGAGGPPGAGGGAGGPPGGGDFSGMRELMVVGGMANQTLPHDLIASLPAKFREVQCSEADGKCTFTGALSDEAADELSGAKRMREMFAGRGGGGAGAGGATSSVGGGATVTAKGTATIVFDVAGNPLSLVIETTTTGPRGDTPRKQAYSLKEFGAVKVEVPKEAAAKLAG